MGATISPPSKEDLIGAPTASISQPRYITCVIGPSDTNCPIEISFDIQFFSSSGRIHSENVRSYKNSRDNAVEVRSCTSQADRKSYAAGKTKKEDDIKNICYATNDKSENKEDMDDNNEIKEDKSDKENNETIKLTKNENKKNKNTIK